MKRTLRSSWFLFPEELTKEELLEMKHKYIAEEKVREKESLGEE